MAIAVLSAPAAAQTIVHSGSQIAIPEKFQDMLVQLPSRPGAWGDLATAYTYQNASDRIELNIFRASYPSTSFWFAQAVTRTKQLFSSGGVTPIGDAEPFTVKAEKPNVMRAFYKPGAPFSSTSVAVMSFGPWLVSIRSTSKTLDEAQQRARLKLLIEQVGPAKAAAKAYPLSLSADCPDTKPIAFGLESERPLTDVTLEMKTAGGVAAMIASKDAVFSAKQGIAAQPATYCRRLSSSGKTIWYETVDPKGLQRWILPVSETGVTVEGILVPTTDKQGDMKMLGVVLINDLTQSSVRGFYTTLPNPISSQLHALTAMLQNEMPPASVKYGTDDLAIVP